MLYCKERPWNLEETLKLILTHKESEWKVEYWEDKLKIRLTALIAAIHSKSILIYLIQNSPEGENYEAIIFGNS